MKHEFTCTRCQQHITHESDSTTGYATNDKNEKICFACCAELDKEQMIKDKKIVLYLTYELKSFVKYGKGKVTNWPGTLSFNCTIQKGKHNLAGSRYDVWFVDHAGNNWHGVQYGENTQLTHCKMLKGE